MALNSVIGGGHMDSQDGRDSRAQQLRAAAYIRMSTAEQTVSPQLQAEFLQHYAAHHGMSIVATYEDRGCSGLVARGRPGLQRLLVDVVSGHSEFSVLLIYDVSRWGRYQNADEAGFYEYQCRRAGIRVVYCAEQFLNDGALMSQLLKSIKRSMAAEYSRELSAKVFCAQCSLAVQGYKQGGAATYGMRRVAVGADGRALRLLEPGEHKPHPADRVRLVPGSDEERAIVRRIFDWYIRKGWSMRAIRRRLNHDGILCRGKCWSDYLVSSVLSKPQYWGTLAYNRRSSKLRTSRLRNPPQTWISAEHALDPIVSIDEGAQAQRIREMRNGSDPEAVLTAIREVYQQYGRVSHSLLSAIPGMPGQRRLVRMFGSLSQACVAAGVNVDARQSTKLDARTQIALRDQLYRKVQAAVVSAGGQVAVLPGRADCMLLNRQLVLRLSIACCRQAYRRPRWRILVRGKRHADFVLAGLLDLNNAAVVRYALVACSAEPRGILYLGSGRYEKSRGLLFPTLASVFGMAEPGSPP